MNFPKGPEIKLRRSKADSDKAGADASEASVVPNFANDVYRDMRDRRLLLPALAILVAILAVPMLLTADSQPVAQTVPPDLKAGVLALDPAVSPEQLVGVRDYDKRLAALKQSNPFDSEIRRELEDSTADADAGAPTDPPAGTSPIADPPSEPSQASPALPASPAAPSTDTGESFLFAPQIDIHMGLVGERKDIDKVNPGDLLPRKSTPVAMFLGASTDLSTAEFLISRDVTKVKGADCKPDRNECQFLSLETGNPVYLRYGDKNKRFALVVNRIRRVQVEEDPQATG